MYTKKIIINYIKYFLVSFVLISIFSVNIIETLAGIKYATEPCIKINIGHKCIDGSNFLVEPNKLVIFEKTTFSQIQKLFGKAEVYKQPKNVKHSKNKICYVDTEGTIKIEFSSRDFSPEYQINGISLSKSKNHLLDKCKKTNFDINSIHSKSGLKLGIAKDKFKKITGISVKNNEVEFEGGMKSKNQLNFINQLINAKFRNKKLESIFIEQTTEPF